MSKIKETSAGILLCYTPENRYLLAQDGHFLSWGIPKGHVEDGETALMAALREFKEETGLLLLNTSQTKIALMPSHEYVVNKRKRVYVFQATTEDENIRDFKFHCDLMTDRGYPEISGYKWVTPEQGRKMASKSQKELFKNL